MVSYCAVAGRIRELAADNARLTRDEVSRMEAERDQALTQRDEAIQAQKHAEQWAVATNAQLMEERDKAMRAYCTVIAKQRIQNWTDPDGWLDVMSRRVAEEWGEGEGRRLFPETENAGVKAVERMRREKRNDDDRREGSKLSSRAAWRIIRGAARQLRQSIAQDTDLLRVAVGREQPYLETRIESLQAMLHVLEREFRV
jgi:hypothetical protein